MASALRIFMWEALVYLFGPSDGSPLSQTTKFLALGENLPALPLLTDQRLGMKYYWCVLPLLACAPLARGADAVRVPYHVETVAGSSIIGDGGSPLAAEFSNIQEIARRPIRQPLSLRHRQSSRTQGVRRT